MSPLIRSRPSSIATAKISPLIRSRPFSTALSAFSALSTADLKQAVQHCYLKILRLEEGHANLYSRSKRVAQRMICGMISRKAIFIMQRHHHTSAPGRNIAYRGAPGRRIVYRGWDQTFHERGGTLTLPHDTQAYMEEHVSSIGSKKAFAE